MLSILTGATILRPFRALGYVGGIFHRANALCCYISPLQGGLKKRVCVVLRESRAVLRESNVVLREPRVVLRESRVMLREPQG